MEIDALITSVDDPQLPRCLEAVNGQIVPFSKIIHINNVCPTSEAFNTGIRESTGDWVMYIGGDVILDNNATKRITEYIAEHYDNKMCTYGFGAYDTFLHCKMGYLSVLNGPLYRTLKFPDHLICDHVVMRNLRKQGWKTTKLIHFIVCTHFDNPDEYQVFKRCYIHGIRYLKEPEKSLKWKFIPLFKETGNPLYQLGIKAIEYAEKKKYYPGSHNLIFDRQNYEDFKKESDDRLHV